MLAVAIGVPLPILNGPRVNDQYGTYRRNLRGIYYISVDNPLQLIEVGTYGYLHGVDAKSFVVLADNWAKDRYHVWNGSEMISEADAASFHIDGSGLAKDKNSVFIPDAYTYRPMRADIDVATAAYFIRKGEGQYGFWIRDKDKVWFEETEVQVDRNTFRSLGNSNWWIDRNWVYTSYWDPDAGHNVLVTVDTLHAPLDILEAGSSYLRNGRNIIYLSQVVVRGIDVHRFEGVGVGKCVVNDMLLKDGKQILKGVLDVSRARFYFYGHIVTDGRHVFYANTLLRDVDAATFHQTGEKTYEDRNFIYTLKENTWQEQYPFNKKRKNKTR